MHYTAMVHVNCRRYDEIYSYLTITPATAGSVRIRHTATAYVNRRRYDEVYSYLTVTPAKAGVQYEYAVRSTHHFFASRLIQFVAHLPADGRFRIRYSYT